MITKLFRAIALLVALFLSAAAFAQTGAPARAAIIELVHGPVSVLAADGRAREGRVGELIFSGETVVTGVDAELHALTADHGFIAVRPETRTRIKELRANGDDDDAVSIELIKGTLRLISGWIGKHSPRNYAVTTPTATIGIRGTDHEPSYFPPEEHREGVEPGTFEKVNSGETVLHNAAGEVSVKAGESAFAPHNGSAGPSKLAKLPDFYRRTATEDHIDERKAVIEPEQEVARARRASEVKARKSGENTTSQTEPPTKGTEQKEVTEKAASDKEQQIKDAESKETPKVDASTEEGTSHRTSREPAKKEKRPPSTR